MPKVRAIVITFACLLSAGVWASPVAGDEAKPNIVVFLLDDTNPTDGRLWSDPTLTPNLYDLFVAHGTQFDNAYGETPLCCPSRATLLTGLHTHNHGVIRNDARLFNPSENLGKELTTVGYQPMLIGKYMNVPNLLTPAQWTASASGWSVFDVMSSDSDGTPNRYYYDYTMYTKDQGTLTFGETPDAHSTRVITNRAVARLQAADTTKPVFEMLSLFNTHAPNIPMPGLEADPRWAACSNMPSWDPPNYNEADVSDKPNYVANLPLLPNAHGWPMDGYCREMLGVDWSVGQVVDELKTDGRYDNTMFVFLADNGMAWGQHRIGQEKQSPYATRVPLYYSFPSRWGTASRTIHEYVSDIDFAPTICAVAGCTLGPFPGGQAKPDGVSVLPLLDGDEDHLDRDALLEDNFESRTWTAVRTTPESPLGLWHYVVNWPSGFKELYNDASDPWELNNVASNPGNADLEAQLEQRLIQLRAEGRPNNPAKITIIEESTPDGANDFTFNGDFGTFKLDDDSNKTLPKKKVFSVPPGDYTLTQTKAGAWSLTNILCPFPTDIDVPSGTVVFHVLQNDNVTCTFKNLRRRPDVSVAQADIGPYKGDNIYSLGPVKKQTLTHAAAVPGTQYVYYLKVQNDGKQPDSITVKGTVSGPASMSTTIWSGTTDVTSAVLAGTFTTPVLATAGILTLTIHVQVSALAVPGDKEVVSVTTTSVNAPGAVDVVRAITTV